MSTGADDEATKEWLAKTKAYFLEEDELREHSASVAADLEQLISEISSKNFVAVEKLYASADLTVRALEHVRLKHPALVRRLAETKLNWPVGLAAYQRIETIRAVYDNLIAELGLGTKIDSVFNYEASLKKYVGQNDVRLFVIETLKRMEAIRRDYRRAIRRGWYDALLEGNSDFSVGDVQGADPVGTLRVKLAVGLPPLEKSPAVCAEWIDAIRALIRVEADGDPAKDPRFRKCGEGRARSKSNSYERNDRLKGILNENSFDANIRDAIMRQIAECVRFVAPDTPTEELGEYLPPKRSAK